MKCSSTGNSLLDPELLPLRMAEGNELAGYVATTEAEANLGNVK